MKNTSLFHLIQIFVTAAVVILETILITASPARRDVEIVPFTTTGGTAEVIGQVDPRPSLIFRAPFPFPETISFVNLTELWDCNQYKIGYDGTCIFVSGTDKKKNTKIGMEQMVTPHDYWYRLQAIEKVVITNDPDHITMFVQYGKAWLPVIIYIVGLIVSAWIITLLSKLIIFRQRKEILPVNA